MRRLLTTLLLLSVSCHSPPAAESIGQLAIVPDTTGAAQSQHVAPEPRTRAAAHVESVDPPPLHTTPREVTTPVVASAPVDIPVSLCCDEPSGLCYVLDPDKASCDSETSEAVECSTISVRCIDKDLGIFVCAD